MNEQNRKKKLRIKYRLSIVFFGTVLIFGLMFYRYIHSVTLEDVLSSDRTITVFNRDKAEDDDGSVPANAGGPEGTSGEPAEIVNPVPECEPVEDSYLEKCVFIGDSLTFGLSSYGIVPSSNVLSSVSMSVSRAETEQIDTQYGSVTIIEALGNMTPENIYVMLGSNGAAYMTSADMYQSYQSFLNKLRIACPDSKVYIISTPPVTGAREESTESPVKNSVIDELNEKLLEYADKNSVRYLDLASALKNADGCLPADYADNDGMHFKYSTYELFIDYILSHVSD